MRKVSVRPTLTMKGRTFKGLRGWSGKPLHPPLTDLPIAAYIYRTEPVTPVGIAVLSVVIALLASAGAMFGGSLVYDYGFNVETAGDHPVWHQSETDVFPGQ